MGFPGQGSDHFSPGERVPGIVHDTVKVIGLSQGLHFLNLHLQEVILLPCKDHEKSGGGVEGVASVLPYLHLSEGGREVEGKGTGTSTEESFPAEKAGELEEGRVGRPLLRRRTETCRAMLEKNRTSQGQEKKGR